MAQLGGIEQKKMSYLRRGGTGTNGRNIVLSGPIFTRLQTNNALEERSDKYFRALEICYARTTTTPFTQTSFSRFFTTIPWRWEIPILQNWKRCFASSAVSCLGSFILALKPRFVRRPLRESDHWNRRSA